MLSDVDSKTSHVTILAPKYWIAEHISARRNATRGSVHLAELRGSTGATAGKWRRRGNVVREILGVMFHVKSCLIAESTSAIKGVILASVVIVHYRAKEIVLVEREFMKEWFVMLLRLCVDLLVIIS
jgi:hypothetical protein